MDLMEHGFCLTAQETITKGNDYERKQLRRETVEAREGRRLGKDFKE